MDTLTTVIGLLAAAGTTFAYVPQVYRSWRTGSVADLSLWTMLLLTIGVILWIVYGAFRGDFVVILANGVTLVLVASLLVLKIDIRKAGAVRRR